MILHRINVFPSLCSAGRLSRGTHFYRAAAAVGCVLIAGSCAAVGPDYNPPQTSFPDAFAAPRAALGGATAPELHEWWRRLEDPVLDGLVQTVLAGNLDLQASLARIREARAIRGIAAADRLPTIDLTGAFQSTQQSRETAQGSAGPRRFESHSVGIEAAWELDLWGRVRRQVEAADADVGASVEDTRLLLVSLIAETASTYIDWLRIRSQIEIATSNLTLQSQTVELTENQFNANLVSQLDVAQARSLRDGTRASIPLLRAEQWTAQNRLAVLAGVAPGELPLGADGATTVRPSPAEIATGFPADLIRRRPDIRLAERLLAAETARVGVAEGDLYPRFSFFGDIGFQALDADELVGSRAVRYSFGPSLRWNLFDRRRIRDAVDAADARVEAALLFYEATVLRALEEVENAVVLFAEAKVREEALESAVTEVRRSVELSRDQYRQGLVSFQSVLDTQSRQFQFEAELADTRALIGTSFVSLHRALGGGWESRDIVLAEPSSATPKEQSTTATSLQP